MATTTPTELHGPRALTAGSTPWLQRDNLIAAAVIFSALLLLVLAANQLLTQLSRIPANSYFKQQRPHFLDPEAGPAYIRETAKRLRQIPLEQRGEQEWRRLALAELLLPLPNTEPETLAQQRNAIGTALNATLIRNPVHPLSWAYLADLRKPPASDCAQAMAALRQSYQVAPVEPDWLAYRLQLATQCPMHWDTAFLNALRTDLLSAYGYQPVYARNRAFTLWLINQPRVEALVHLLLRKHPDALARFERYLQRVSAKTE